MKDVLLRSLPMFLAPVPIVGSRPPRVALRRRGSGGFGFWGICLKKSVRASDLDLVYYTESSDGSVLFRFGTASEIAEYMALKEAEISQVEDGMEEENVVSGYQEETLELVDEVASTDLCLEDVENEVDGTSGSSEILSGVRISSDYVGVTDSLDIHSNELIEGPLVLEDKYEGLPTGNVVVENIGSYEILVNSECENKLDSFEKTGNSYGDFEHTLGNEEVSVESSSVLDDSSKFKLEKDKGNVENAHRSADDFGVNVGKDNTPENLNAFDENDDGNAFKEPVVVKSIISDEDFESISGDQSKVVEDGIVLESVALEPDVTVSMSLDDASSNVDKEEVVSSHSVDDGTIELSNIKETIISAVEIESDDKGIPVVVGNLTANDDMACDSNKEYVSLQKTTTSEVILKENTQDFGSLLGNILDSVSIVEQPYEISNQKGGYQTSDAAASLSAIIPANLSTGEGVFSDKCSDETNMIQDTISIATSSTNQADTDRSNYLAKIPVASQLENDNEIILDERFNFDMGEGFLSTTSFVSLNMTSGNATSTSEVTEVKEGDILGSSHIASEEAEQLPVQVAEREESSPVKLHLSIGAALLPKTSEALTGGEDAYFIAGETWFGVADGVGPWSLEGIDAGLFGHELMECCRRIISDGACSPTNTKEVLSRSAAEATLPGSATVLVAYFDGQVLHVSNIGDTGFVIVRNGVILTRSSPTVYDFHFPHQIQKGDNPLEFVEVYEMELNESDIIVAATDGLFDNIYDQEIAAIVTKSLQASMNPEEVAAVLAVKAQEIGGSTSSRSPFADAAKAAGYAGCTGGKLDDVAVIVSVVQMKQ